MADYQGIFSKALQTYIRTERANEQDLGDIIGFEMTVLDCFHMSCEPFCIPSSPVPVSLSLSTQPFNVPIISLTLDLHTTVLRSSQSLYSYSPFIRPLLHCVGPQKRTPIPIQPHFKLSIFQIYSLRPFRLHQRPYISPSSPWVSTYYPLMYPQNPFICLKTPCVCHKSRHSQIKSQNLKPSNA